MSATTRALLWGSSTVWAAELTRGGEIEAANPALEDWAGRSLAGEPFAELLAAPQRVAFATRLESPELGAPATLLSFHQGGTAPAEDRWLRFVRDDGELFVVAEPAGAEHARLVTEVLELNDDLIKAQRSLARRQRELERAQAEARDAMRQVRRLESITLAGLRLDDVDGVLRALLRTAAEVLDGDGAAVSLTEEDGVHLTLAAAIGSEEVADRPARVEVGEGLLGRVAVDAHGAQAMPDGLTGGSLAVVPLRVDGRLLGVLHVVAAVPGRYEAADLRLLERVGERAALAIGHAQLRDRERRMAEILQRSLLPEALPDVAGVTLAARYLPSAKASNVGGDFYDAVALPGGGVGLIVGDVAGKGLRAASSTGQVRATMRAYAVEGLGPADVLERLDTLVAEQWGMVTALYAVVDPAAGVITWSNAGHPPPLLLGAAGGAAYLEGGLSAPLGVQVGARPTADVPLTGAGTGILLYTDGLVERRRQSLDDGFAALRAAAAAAPADPEELCDRLVSGLAGTGYQDDVALLAAKVG